MGGARDEIPSSVQSCIVERPIMHRRASNHASSVESCIEHRIMHRASKRVSSVETRIERRIMHRVSKNASRVELCIERRIVHRASNYGSSVETCIERRIMHRASKHASSVERASKGFKSQRLWGVASRRALIYRRRASLQCKLEISSCCVKE